MKGHGLLSLLPLALAVSACSPAFDWREVRPPESEAVLNLPCKGEFQNRKSPSGLRMGLAHCRTGGFEFAFSWAELNSAADVPTAMAQMREALAKQPGARFEVRSQGVRVYQLLVQGVDQTDKPVPAQVWQDFVGSVHLGD